MHPDLYSALLDVIKLQATMPPDQPDETPESTLQSLWHTAAGNPCSAKVAARSPIKKLTDSEAEILRRLVAKRCEGTPLMQITQRAHFMDLELEFAPEVFIVRPETEILCTAAIAALSSGDAPVAIDMGCGSGNVTCGILHALTSVSMHAVDILQSCVDLTIKNAIRCGVAGRVTVSRGDLFAPLETLGLESSVDAVICNPPYIASSRLAGDRSYLVAHEPREAFDGGPFGFGVHLRLIKESLKFLKPGGALLFEFGAGQENQVKSLFDRTGGYTPVGFIPDRTGVARVVTARKKN
jgi:release factor glutamine methyltransferase